MYSQGVGKRIDPGSKVLLVVPCILYMMYTVDIYRHVIGKNNVIGANRYSITYIFASILLTNLSLRAKSNKTDAKL